MFKIIFFIGFISSSQAIIFTIEGWYDMESGSVGRLWGVIVRTSEIETSKVLTNVNTATYPFGRNASQVQIIYIQKCSNLTYIPRRMKVFFQNFYAIQLQDCGIQSLESSDFKSYENLRFLALVRNKLERIPGNLFSLTPQINDFWAQSNQIKSVDENALSNAPLLRHVDLANNICTSGYALSREEVLQLSHELKWTCGNYQTTTDYRTTTITARPCGRKIC